MFLFNILHISTCISYEYVQLEYMSECLSTSVEIQIVKMVKHNPYTFRLKKTVKKFQIADAQLQYMYSVAPAFVVLLNG